MKNINIWVVCIKEGLEVRLMQCLDSMVDIVKILFYIFIKLKKKVLNKVWLRVVNFSSNIKSRIYK